MSTKNTQLANSLKDEGNVLFTQKKFAQADAKYTKALGADDTIAVIWANRAACRLSTRRWVAIDRRMFRLFL